VIDTGRVTVVDSSVGGGNEGDATIEYGDPDGVTLSPTAGTIEGEGIQITERGRELDGTHIRVLGAHEGEAQLFVNLVPSDDPATYANEVRYSTPRWTEDADTDWDRWSDNDITDQATLETEAESIGEELADTLVKAETVVPTSVALNVGDTVRVVKDDADLDRDMRVHRLARRAGTYNNTAGDAAVVDKVYLSTRTTLQTDDDAELEEIRKFNTGFQGASVSVQGGGSRQPVNASINAEIPFDYPDLQYENEATVQVRGLEYRAYSSGAAGGSASEYTNPEYNIAANDGLSTTASVAVDSEVINSPTGTFSGALVSGYVFNATGREDTFDLTVSNLTQSTTLYADSITLGDLESRAQNVPLSTSEVSVGDFVEFDVSPQSSEWGTDSTRTWPLSTVAMVVNTRHTHEHAADPGITEFTNETPSNVDLIVNGTTVATNIGSGTFETEIDINDTMNPGEWNLIEVASDSLGHVQANITLDGYKQIGRNV
jgi:hypothetical protein